MPDNALTKPATPGPGQQLLAPFVGLWNTTGIQKGDAATPDIPINGTDVYEWLPGGFFLLHRVDVHFGEERIQSIEIIAFDASANNYTMHSFDSLGNADLMHATVNNGTWTYEGTSMRFTGSFSEGGNVLSGIWERSEDGQNWQHWMDIKLSRAT